MSIERQTIINRLYDPGQLAKKMESCWDKAPYAVPLEELPPETQAALFPAASRIERVSDKSNSFDSVVGGLCSVFTGDYPLMYQDGFSIVSRIRMDQAVESVGIVNNKPSLIVIEDDLWREMFTGINIDLFQRQSDRAKKAIEKWMQLTATGTSLTIVRTSDISLNIALKEAVNYLGTEILQNPNFGKLDCAPVLVMYTSLWSELLYNLGYLPSDKTICIEPVNHFIADRRFPNFQMQGAFDDYLEWLKTEPYGKPGSRNKNFSIAGFTPSVSGDQTKQRMRLLPASAVPNTDNYRQWTKTLQEQVDLFPFPLRNNLLFAEGTNWGMWNPDIVKNLYLLTQIEERYYQERKKGLSSERQAACLKAQIQEQAKPALIQLVIEVSNILTKVLS